MRVQPGRAEEKDAEEEGYFFQIAGAIRFSDAGMQAPGYAINVVVADRYGFVAYSDLAAVYVATSHKLLEAASRDVKNPPVLDPATLCVAKLPVPHVTILSLSADQLLLACVSGNSVQIFSLPHLLNHQSDAPVYSMSLSRELTHFSWCPDSSERDITSFIAVTVDHVLLHGSLISGTGTLAEGVECACWSPSGQYIAYSSGNKLVVTAPDWKETAFVVDIPPPEGESGQGVHVVDSITWPAPAGIAASSLWSDEAAGDGEEGEDGYLLGITWDTWQGTAAAKPQGTKASLTSYVTVADADEDPGCGQHEWPYLRSVYVPAWSLLIHAHRKACDEHIRLMELTDGQVFALEQRETQLVAAVPTPDERENFIVGMAVDYSNQDSMPHPLSQEKADVPASCVLLVATLDGVLRLYRLANFMRQQGLARTPQLMPNSLPQSVLNALAAATNAPLEEESETSVSSPSPPVSSFMQQLASAQSSTSGAAPSAGSSSGAAQQQHRRSSAVGSGTSPSQGQQQQQLREAAETALPLEDDDFDELEGEGGSAVSLAAGGDAAVSQGKSTDDGWGSSEEAEDSEEATSQPLQGQQAERAPSSRTHTEAFGTASSSAPGSSSTLFDNQPLSPAAQQRFYSPGSSAFSFATAGSSRSLVAGATTSNTTGGSFLGSFGFDVAGSSSAAPAFGAMSASTSAPALGSAGARAPAPALGSTRSAPSADGTFASPAPGTSTSASAAASDAAVTKLANAAAASTPSSRAAAISKPLFGETAAPMFGSAFSAPSASSASSTPASCTTAAPGAPAPFGTPALSTSTAAGSATPAAPFAGLLGHGTGIGDDGGSSSLPGDASVVQLAAAGTGAFTVPTIVSADEFKPSTGWRGPEAGFVFTTGTHGTGYYKDKVPQSAPAAAAPAVVSTGASSNATNSLAAASQTKPVAAGSAAAAARKLAAHQQQAGTSKVQVKVPSVTVAAPKPQLVDQGQQVAEAEAAFLRSLHQVANMSAELQQFMNQMAPSDVAKWDVAQQMQQLRKQAVKLRAGQKQQKQFAVELIDSWDDVNRQQAALAMFHPRKAGTAAIEAQMPLEPALAALQDNIQESFEVLSSNMEDLEQQLERWQRMMQLSAASTPSSPARTPLMGGKAAAGGLASSTGSSTGPFRGIGLKHQSRSPWATKVAGVRPVACLASPRGVQPAAAAGAPGHGAQVELLYKVVSAQQDTARNLTARISTLAQELERLGVARTDTDHMGGKTLGKWGDDMGSGSGHSDDGGYGSAPGVDEDDYERGAHTPSPSGLTPATFLSTPATGATPAALARFGLPRTTPSSSWGTLVAATPVSARSHSANRGVGTYPWSAVKTPGSRQWTSPATNSAASHLYSSSSKLHWVTPGCSGAKKQPASSSSRQQQQLRAGSSPTTSSAAWQKFASELSHSASKSTGGSADGRKSHVRTTVATPLPASSSRGRSRRQLQQESGACVMSPPRPPSPLQITAAAAATTATGSSPAPPSAAFSFTGQSPATQTLAAAADQHCQGQQRQPGFTTPAAHRLPGRLDFSSSSAAAALSTSAAAPASGPGSSPGGLFGGLSPVPSGTPGTTLAAAEEHNNPPTFNFFSANPLFDRSPGAVAPSPIAAVPPPALQLGAGAPKAAGGGDRAAAASALKPPTAPAGSKAKSSQPPEPPPAALAQAAALEHKVLNRSTSVGSSGSSPQPAAAAPPSAAAPVKPKPAANPASKATSQPPEPPAALLAAVAQTAKQIPQQAKAAHLVPAGPSPAAVSAAAAAASRILARQEMQQPQDEAATAVTESAAEAEAPTDAAEPPVAMTQHAQAALQRVIASQAVGSSATAAAKPKASSQPPEPPGSLVQAAAQAASKFSQQASSAAGSKPAEVTAATAAAGSSSPLGNTSAFGAFGSTEGLNPAAISGTSPPSSSSVFGSTSSGSAASSAATPSSSGAASSSSAVRRSSSNAADALNAMLGAQGTGGAFGGFGALGLGGETATTPASSAAPAAASSPFAGLTFGTPSAANAFGATATGNTSSGAAATNGSFGSFGFGVANSSAATASSSGGNVSGSSSSSSVFGGVGGGRVQSASNPFGGLLSSSGGGGSSSSSSVFGPAFGTTVPSSPAAGSAPFVALPRSPAASSPFGTPTAASTSKDAFGGSSAAPGFGGASSFGATSTGGLKAVTPAFGQPAAPGSPFSGTASPAASSVFGAPAASPAASSSAASVFGSFGQTTAFGQGSTAGSPFGQAAAFDQTAAAVGQSSAFGQAAAPAPSFGIATGGFGQPSTPAAPFGHISTATLSFGQPNAPASPHSGCVFGAAFAQPVTPSSGGFSGFGSAAASGGGFGAFGGADSAAFSTPNPFGGAQQQQQQPSLWAARR